MGGGNESLDGKEQPNVATYSEGFSDIKQFLTAQRARCTGICEVRLDDIGRRPGLPTEPAALVSLLFRMLFGLVDSGDHGQFVFRGMESASWSLLPSSRRRKGAEIIGRAGLQLCDRYPLRYSNNARGGSQGEWTKASLRGSDDSTAIVYPTSGQTLTDRDLVRFHQLHCDAERHAIEEFMQQADAIGLPGLEHMERARIRASAIDDRPHYVAAALAQHHGVPTKLLDWTRNIKVAAYFAALETEDHGDDARMAVYALDTARLVSGAVAEEGEGVLHVMESPRSTDRYLYAQDGLFTWIDDRFDERFVRQRGRWPTLEDALEAESLSESIVYKFTLPRNGVAARLMERLRKDRVTGATIRPAYDSVARDLQARLGVPYKPEAAAAEGAPSRSAKDADVPPECRRSSTISASPALDTYGVLTLIGLERPKLLTYVIGNLYRGADASVDISHLWSRTVGKWAALMLRFATTSKHLRSQMRLWSEDMLVTNWLKENHCHVAVRRASVPWSVVSAYPCRIVHSNCEWSPSDVSSVDEKLCVFLASLAADPSIDISQADLFLTQSVASIKTLDGQTKGARYDLRVEDMGECARQGETEAQLYKAHCMRAYDLGMRGEQFLQDRISEAVRYATGRSVAAPLEGSDWLFAHDRPARGSASAMARRPRSLAKRLKNSRLLQIAFHGRDCSGLLHAILRRIISWDRTGGEGEQVELVQLATRGFGSDAVVLALVAAPNHGEEDLERDIRTVIMDHYERPEHYASARRGGARRLDRRSIDVLHADWLSDAEAMEPWTGCSLWRPGVVNRPNRTGIVRTICQVLAASSANLLYSNAQIYSASREPSDDPRDLSGERFRFDMLLALASDSTVASSQKAEITQALWEATKDDDEPIVLSD